MEDPMQLTIVLRKDVPDREAGKALFDLVVAFLADKPDVDVQGTVSNHFTIEQE